MIRAVFLCCIALCLSGCSSLKSVDTAKELTSSETVKSFEQPSIHKMIADEERKNGIPSGILNSIATVESRHNAYAVNARKKAHSFKTRAEAVKFIKKSLSSGYDNISLGCFQLHYATHKKYFASVDDMLIPELNITYAASLLRTLYDKYGTWEDAIKKYHNGKAKYNTSYYRKVMDVYNSSYKVS